MGRVGREGGGGGWRWGCWTGLLEGVAGVGLKGCGGVVGVDVSFVTTREWRAGDTLSS